MTPSGDEGPPTDGDTGIRHETYHLKSSPTVAKNNGGGTAAGNWKVPHENFMRKSATELLELPIRQWTQEIICMWFEQLGLFM